MQGCFLIGAEGSAQKQACILRRILLHCKQDTRRMAGALLTIAARNRRFLLPAIIEDGQGNGSAPAAIDRENAAATLIYPHATAIPAPRAPFDACRIGRLLPQIYPAAAANIDLAEITLILRAAAGDLETVVPIRPRVPATAAITRARTATSGHETPGATTINPQSAAINTPVAAANTLRVGQLTDDACIAPGHVAAGIGVVAAGAIHGITITLCTHGRNRHEKKHEQRKYPKQSKNHTPLLVYPEQNCFRLSVVKFSGAGYELQFLRFDCVQSSPLGLDAAIRRPLPVSVLAQARQRPSCPPACFRSWRRRLACSRFLPARPCPPSCVSCRRLS